MKAMKNNLDERQEQELLKIEKNGCWLAFWGLLIAIVVQMLVYEVDFRYTLGEWIVFMCLSVYLGASCITKGIWDRRLKADPKTNFLVSCVAAIVAFAIFFAITLKRYPDKMVGAIASGVFLGAFVFVLCMVDLTVSSRMYQKRVKELEGEDEEEEE